MEFAHSREVGGKPFAVTCLQLLNEKLNVRGNDFFGGLGLGVGWHGGDVAHGLGSSLLNGPAVFAYKHALALAHASGGGKCKRRVPYPE